MKRVLNILGVGAIIFLAYFFYTNNTEYFAFFDATLYFRIFGNLKTIDYIDVFWYSAWAYFGIFIFFYLLVPNQYNKPVFFRAGLWTLLKKLFYNRQIVLPVEQKNALLNITVKFIYLPLMYFWVWKNVAAVSTTWYAFSQNLGDYASFFEMYRTHLYWLIFNILFFVDVLIFSVGYAVELKVLGNKIRSVQPSLFGWMVALACYPIFNYLTGWILQWYSTDFPNFVQYFQSGLLYESLTVIFGTIFLVLIIIYVRASIALGFKASNLTHRGIVWRGPYRFVRHPAYASKNLARIIGAIPVIAVLFRYSTPSDFDYALFVMMMISLLGRVMIYHLRAITEENHLSEDPEYQAYKKKVKYMYIPKIY